MQHRLEPLNKRVFGGCHLTRPIVELLSGAGFTVMDLDVFYEKGTPRFAGASSLGLAVALTRPGGQGRTRYPTSPRPR